MVFSCKNGHLNSYCMPFSHINFFTNLLRHIFNEITMSWKCNGLNKAWRKQSGFDTNSHLWTAVEELEWYHILRMQWFERGVKEAIWVRHKKPSLNRSGGVRIKLSHGWNGTIRDIPPRMTSSPVSIPTDRKSPKVHHNPAEDRRLRSQRWLLLNQVYLDDNIQNYPSLRMQCSISNILHQNWAERRASGNIK